MRREGEYEIRPIELSEEGISACSSLLRLAFPAARHFSDVYIRWEYLQNPDGPILGYNAFANGELAAHYAVQPMHATFSGAVRRGVLSLNTATHPLHRRKNLFTQLAEATYRAAHQQGFEFVVGVANANSTRGFLEKLNFDLVGPLEARLGFGLPRRIATASPTFARVWSTESMNWRLRNPARRYRVRSWRGRTVIEAPSGRVGTGVLMYEGSNQWGLVDQRVGAAETGPLKVWIGTDPSIDWSRSKYLEIPRRLRPSPLNLIFKPLRRQALSLSSRGVLVRAIDFDAY